jgi:hypothetical protein
MGENLIGWSELIVMSSDVVGQNSVLSEAKILGKLLRAESGDIFAEEGKHTCHAENVK